MLLNRQRAQSFYTTMSTQNHHRHRRPRMKMRDYAVRNAAASMASAVASAASVPASIHSVSAGVSAGINGGVNGVSAGFNDACENRVK